MKNDPEIFTVAAYSVGEQVSAEVQSMRKWKIEGEIGYIE